jgi:ubiquinone/menaquinone biosynthesis C-methylase UbiE
VKSLDGAFSVQSETLLDVGCGPGMLAIGFAPFVGGGTGLDPEPGMIAAPRREKKPLSNEKTNEPT